MSLSNHSDRLRGGPELRDWSLIMGMGGRGLQNGSGGHTRLIHDEGGGGGGGGGTTGFEVVLTWKRKVLAILMGVGEGSQKVSTIDNSR